VKRPEQDPARSPWWLAPEALQVLERVSWALRAPERLQLLAALVANERNVTTLTRLTGYSQIRVSKHLAVLRRFHMVQARVQGPQRFYQLAADDPAAQAARALLVALLRAGKEPGQP
jgi:DNA-binding transcriptional ArsR family regulator